VTRAATAALQAAHEDVVAVALLPGEPVFVACGRQVAEHEPVQASQPLAHVLVRVVAQAFQEVEHQALRARVPELLQPRLQGRLVEEAAGVGAPPARELGELGRLRTGGLLRPLPANERVIVAHRYNDLPDALVGEPTREQGHVEVQGAVAHRDEDRAFGKPAENI